MSSKKRPAPKVPSSASQSRPSVTNQDKPVGNGHVTSRASLTKSNTLPLDWRPGRNTEDVLRKRMERLKKNIERETQGKNQTPTGSNKSSQKPNDIKSPNSTNRPGRTFSNLSVTKYEKLLQQKRENAAASANLKKQTNEVRTSSSLKGSRVPVAASRRASMSPSSTRSTPPLSSREPLSQRSARERGDSLKSSKKSKDKEKLTKTSSDPPRTKEILSPDCVNKVQRLGENETKKIFSGDSEKGSKKSIRGNLPTAAKQTDGLVVVQESEDEIWDKVEHSWKSEDDEGSHLLPSINFDMTQQGMTLDLEVSWNSANLKQLFTIFHHHFPTMVPKPFQ